MKLSEYKNEDALDLLADLIEPTATIFADSEIREILNGHGAKIQGIKIALKQYPRQIIEILARLDGIPADEYKANMGQMIAKLLEILNDKELVSFFTSQGQETEMTSFGSATENTKGKKK